MAQDKGSISVLVNTFLLGAGVFETYYRFSCWRIAEEGMERLGAVAVGPVALLDSTTSNRCSAENYTRKQSYRWPLSRRTERPNVRVFVANPLGDDLFGAL